MLDVINGKWAFVFGHGRGDKEGSQGGKQRTRSHCELCRVKFVHKMKFFFKCCF